MWGNWPKWSTYILASCFVFMVHVNITFPWISIFSCSHCILLANAQSRIIFIGWWLPPQPGWVWLTTHWWESSTLDLWPLIDLWRAAAKLHKQHCWTLELWFYSSHNLDIWCQGIKSDQVEELMKYVSRHCDIVIWGNKKLNCPHRASWS